jgi:hypothetical protein
MSAVNRIHEDELGWDKRLRTYQGVPFTGVGFRLHPNGKTMFEIPYIDGRPAGRMQEWDSEGRIMRDRVSGKSPWKKLEPGDPDYGWLKALADCALARLTPKARRAMKENALPPDAEVTEYQYDADGNRLYRLEIDPR